MAAYGADMISDKWLFGAERPVPDFRTYGR